MTHAKKTEIHESANDAKNDDGKSNKKKSANEAKNGKGKSDEKMPKKWQSKEKDCQHEQEVGK